MNAARYFDAGGLGLAALLAGCLTLALATSVLAAGSRVIVSATLNSTLQFYDSDDFHELQPPLPSRGGGPVRLWVQEVGGKPYLFAANHGAVIGSLGVFDLSGALATELPLSPFPAGPGSVGVVAGELRVGDSGVPMAFVTNAISAVVGITPLGCMLPKGSVTGFDLTLLSTAGLAQPIGTVDVSSPVPYAVSFDGGDGLAFVSGNCAGTLDTIEVKETGSVPSDLPLAARFSMTKKTPPRAVGSGPDATLFAGGRSYTNNITEGSITVYDATSPTPLTTVPLKRADGKSAGPIDANLADTPGGRHLIVTSNGSDDSVSLIDRDVIESCILAVGGPKADCAEAEVLRVKTAVPGGAPEGIDYDPVTNRIFTVNKTIGSPSLSVIQLSEDLHSGADIHRIPIVGIDAAAPVPALIAFDVVVQKP